MTKTMTLVQVLRSGRQADPDGVEVRISRQAVEEAAQAIEHLDADAAGLQAELASVKACWSEALANVSARNQEIERLKDRLETQKGVIANHVEAERRSSEPCEQRPSPSPPTARMCAVCRRMADDSGTTSGWGLCHCGSFRKPLSEGAPRGAGSKPCEQPSREQLLQFARTILAGTTNTGIYNGRCPQELWNEFFPMDEPGVVTPEFAAEFERGTMGAILKELSDFVQGRDQPYWAGFEFALEEMKCRLDIAWKALPTEQSEGAPRGTGSDEVVRFDANRKIIGCTCPDEVRGKPMPAPDPNCPISFPHAEVAWGKRRKHNDDSPLGAKIRAGEQQ